MTLGISKLLLQSHRTQQRVTRIQVQKQVHFLKRRMPPSFAGIGVHEKTYEVKTKTQRQERAWLSYYFIMISLPVSLTVTMEGVSGLS